MKRIIFVCLILVLITAGSSFAWRDTEISRLIPLPKKIEIAPPSADLPKEIASFSGRWEGIWEEGPLNAILIVEKIDSKEARVIYGWGDCYRWRAKRNYASYKAKVIPGLKPKLEFFSAYRKFTFEMGEDLKTINGTFDLRGAKYNITMKTIEDD